MVLSWPRAFTPSSFSITTLKLSVRCVICLSCRRTVTFSSTRIGRKKSKAAWCLAQPSDFFPPEAQYSLSGSPRERKKDCSASCIQAKRIPEGTLLTKLTYSSSSRHEAPAGSKSFDDLSEGVRLWLFAFVSLPYRATEARQKKAISKKQSLTPIPVTPCRVGPALKNWPRFNGRDRSCGIALFLFAARALRSAPANSARYRRRETPL